MKKKKPCNGQNLTERAAEGDEAVLADIVGCLENNLLQFARRYCKNSQDAQDVLQDAYVAAAKHLKGFQGSASIKTWMTRLVISACSKRKRGIRNDPSIHIAIEDLSNRRREYLSKSPEAEDTLFRQEVFLDLKKALKGMNKTDQTVLLLRDGKELSAKETADFLGLSVSAVKSRLHRARKHVREHLLQGALSDPENYLFKEEL